MKLEDLQASVREMSTEDLEELLRSIRHNRTTENVIAKKEKVNKTKQDEISKLLSKLSSEQIAALLGGN
jgi:Glu-tRNA(Gln) amidotransferase subunit E-like FAD-binding protein